MYITDNTSIHMYASIYVCIPTYSVFVSHYMDHDQQLDYSRPNWTGTNPFSSVRYMLIMFGFPV